MWGTKRIANFTTEILPLRSRAPLGQASVWVVYNGVMGIAGARAALVELGRTLPVADPLAASIARHAMTLGGKVDLDRLFDFWVGRSVGSPAGPDRYRWELTHARATGIPDYAGPPETWHAWHPEEQQFVDRDPFAFEERFLTPIVLTETAELLASTDHPRARALLEEAEPVLRRDLASHALARHAWTDTFALWLMASCPHTLRLVRPLAVAIAETYVAVTRHGGAMVEGTRFPFHGKPMCSASAQLASGLLAVGMNIDLASGLIAELGKLPRTKGGYGDADQPPDVLTTLAVADLLASVDPSYDTTPTQEFFATRQLDTGWWRAFGPEMPWLTARIVQWSERSEAPFASRFRWPEVPLANLDRKTGLPFFAYFADLAELFRRLPGVAHTQTELAFIDLAGFRAFNNRFGQERGDQALAVFASALQGIDSAAKIRDGGDEFLVVGAPTRQGLERDLERFRNAWPEHFSGAFGSDIPPVAPRILLTRASSSQLMAAREQLGRAVGQAKQAAPNPNAHGVLLRIELAG